MHKYLKPNMHKYAVSKYPIRKIPKTRLRFMLPHSFRSMRAASALMLPHSLAHGLIVSPLLRCSKGATAHTLQHGGLINGGPVYQVSTDFSGILLPVSVAAAWLGNWQLLVHKLEWLSWDTGSGWCINWRDLYTGAVWRLLVHKFGRGWSNDS